MEYMSTHEVCRTNNLYLFTWSTCVQILSNTLKSGPKWFEVKYSGEVKWFLVLVRVVVRELLVAILSSNR